MSGSISECFRRMSLAATEKLGTDPYASLRATPDLKIAAVEADIGIPLPAGVRELFSSVDGFAAFSWEIDRVESCRPFDEVLLQIRYLAEELPPLGPLPPTGSVYLTGIDGAYLIVTPHSTVMVFDWMTQQFFDAAPSVLALFEAWAELAEAGWIVPMGGTDDQAGIALDDLHRDEAATILDEHGCSLPAAWVIPDRP